MNDDVEWTAEDQKRYWDDVKALADWFLDFLEGRFKQIHAGSGDTLMDLEALQTRIKNEGLERVANAGVPETVLWDEDYGEKYSDICDVVERTYQKMPLDEDDLFLHTSSEARAATTRIFEILGLTALGDGIYGSRDHVWYFNPDTGQTEPYYPPKVKKTETDHAH